MRWRRHEWKCDRKHGQICKSVAENQWPSLIENILALPVSGLNWSQLVDINDGPGSDWHWSDVHLQGSCYMQPLPAGKLLAASYEESCENYTAVSLTMSVHCPALNSFCKLEWTLNHFQYTTLWQGVCINISLWISPQELGLRQEFEETLHHNCWEEAQDQKKRQALSLQQVFWFWMKCCPTSGRHNLRSFLAANSTQNYFLIARMLSFLWHSRQKCRI